MSQARLKHGSESFFIEGEGLLTTQVGGRSGDEADPVSESESPRVPAPRALAAEVPPPFRFSRVGPRGTALGAAATKKLARAMVVGGGGAGDVPAGYTYLGQFIDHDLTMDRTDVMFGDDVRPSTCSRAGPRAWTSTRSTATVPATRPRRGSTPTACTSRPVRRSRSCPTAPSPGTTCPGWGRGRTRPRSARR